MNHINVYCLISIFRFIHNSVAYIEVTGELTFDVHPANANTGNGVRVREDEDAIGSKINRESNFDSRAEATAINVDVDSDGAAAGRGPGECVYRYPNRRQLEALLSDMRNHLAKIFVRAYAAAGGRAPRRADKRFKIISKKLNSSFFEEAYNLMSDEYRQSINTTVNEVKLSQDPCRHQHDIKQQWRAILDHSKAVLRRAAGRCVRDVLRVRSRADDAGAREKLHRLVVREVREARYNQLKVLCDEFKLCYKDLL